MQRLIILVLLTSCGSMPTDWEQYDERSDTRIDYEAPEPKIQSVIDEFYDDCNGKYGTDLSNLNKLESVKFGEPSSDEFPNRIGVCHWWTRDGELTRARVVVKDIEQEFRFKALMYHELGHCVLQLGHTDQNPYTLMSPALKSNEQYLEENWDELVEQLCTMLPSDAPH